MLAALLSSLDSSLPKTAYFKHVDVWFFWFIIHIVLLVVLHIQVDRYIKVETDEVLSLVPTGLGYPRQKLLDKNPRPRVKRSLRLNRAGKLYLPVIVIIFIFIYFPISVTDQLSKI